MKIQKFNEIIKTYKNDQAPKLKIGDYVILKIHEYKKRYMNRDKIAFFESHIGEVDTLKQDYFGVKFDESYDSSIYFFFNYDDIEVYSENKKDVEDYFSMKKYNI